MAKLTTRRRRDNGLTAISPADRYVLGNHNFAELPVNTLIVDAAYQRDINESAIQRIINNFDWNLLEPPTVNRRRKGEHVVIDGQHRVEALRRMHVPMVTSRVVEVNHDLEARLFVELNRQRIWLAPIPTFKAELNAGNPAALEINRCLESRGLRVGMNKGASDQVSAVAAIKMIYARGGFVGLGRVLDTILLAWNEDTERRFIGNVLLGVDGFYRQNVKAEPTLVGERLNRITPQHILAQASQRWYAWKGLGKTGKSVVDCVADEIQRIYRKRRP